MKYDVLCTSAVVMKSRHNYKSRIGAALFAQDIQLLRHLEMSFVNCAKNNSVIHQPF